MREIYTKWALSTEIEGERCLLGWPAWSWRWTINMKKGVRLFHTREDARSKQQDCNYTETRVEEVQVIVETIQKELTS